MRHPHVHFMSVIILLKKMSKRENAESKNLYALHFTHIASHLEFTLGNHVKKNGIANYLLTQKTGWDFKSKTNNNFTLCKFPTPSFYICPCLFLSLHCKLFF
jgi:hypothetical protein